MGDFLEYLGPDNSFNVLMCLDDPSVLVRMSSLSRSWLRFVIGNGFCKKLCLQMHPEVSNFTSVVQVSDSREPMEVGSSNSLRGESPARDHWVYSHLAYRLKSAVTRNDCIDEAVSASSTDNYPEESIDNTLEPSEKILGRPSYWSSEGTEDPELPETLTYRLISNLCVVHEIKIQPFEAYFQHGNPIYSAKAVRFKLGHSKSLLDMSSSTADGFLSDQNSANEDYVWTYISPKFPMAQENRLQTFKLPRPVICIGGILQIELLGRVQQQEMDSRYYICVCHVEVVGVSLFPTFDVNIFPGNCILKHFPEDGKSDSPKRVGKDAGAGSSGWQAFTSRIRRTGAVGVWGPVVILNTLLGHAEASNGNSGNESDGSILVEFPW